MVLELILITTISTGVGIGIGLFFNQLKDNINKNSTNYVLVNNVMDNIHTIHYQIDNINYSIVVDTSLPEKMYNLPKVKDTLGNNITNTIENYIRGITSIVPKEKIIPLYLNLKNLLIEDTDITYYITSNSSLFGLTGV